MAQHWAKVNGDNIVVNIECASPEWIAEWRVNNPDSPYRYIETSLDDMGHAGVDFTYDEPTGWFIPPVPDLPGEWVFNRDTWMWVNESAS